MPPLRRLLLAVVLCGSSQLLAEESALERGLAQVRAGAFTEGLALLDEVLANATQQDSESATRAQYGRGSAFSGLGDYAAAAAAFGAVLQVCEDPASSAPCADARVGLAHVEARRGNYARASGLIDAVLALTTDKEGATRHADILYGFAVVLSMSGDHAHAIEVAERALASEQAIDPPRVFDQALVRFLLGTAQLESGRADLALPLLEAAADGFADVLPAAHPGHAMLVTNRGNALLALERLDEAEAAYREALARYPDDGSPERLFPQSGLATIALWQGEAASAVDAFGSVQQGLDAALGSQSAASQFVRAGHAAALWSAGRFAEAFALARESEAARQALLDGVAPAFAERQALALKSVLQPGYEWAIAIAASEPEAKRVREAWELLMAARGEVTATVALRRAEARAASDPALQSLWQNWRERNDALAAAVAARLQGGGEDVSALRDAAERAERSLAAEVAALQRARQQRALRLDALQQALPEDAALVVHLRLRQGSPEAFDRRRDSERFARRVAFVLLPDGDPQLIDLGRAAPIEAAAEAWHDALRDPRMALARVEARGATLRRLMHEPLQLPATLGKLFVISDAALARINLAALPDASGRALLEGGLAVHTLEHEHDLLGEPQPASGMQRLMLVGASQGDVQPNATARLAGCDAPMPSLPQVSAELDAIAKLWRSQNMGALQRLDRGAARKSAVREALPGGGILHLATHGLAFSPDCRSDTRSLQLAGATTGAPFSALVLDGAEGPISGILLSAEEIAALDLSGTGWAVLSACETGLGSEVAGEGVFGLRRAFRIAGARSVIMSLWPVQDAATADWMTALYRARLVDGASTIDAVAAAQRELLTARRARGESVHPYYWAAFVSAGDWR